MDEYEANHPDEPKKEDSGSSKRKAEDKPSKPATPRTLLRLWRAPAGISNAHHPR